MSKSGTRPLKPIRREYNRKAGIKSHYTHPSSTAGTWTILPTQGNTQHQKAMLPVVRRQYVLIYIKTE